MTGDEVFFSEWRSRLANERRSLRRAGLLADRLGLARMSIPVLTIVGSKGKGTAAAHASARLAAAGLRVVTITSPGLRSNRERIRLDGLAISAAVLENLGERLAAAIGDIEPRRPGAGYLSPGGLFIVAGVFYASSLASADVIVLEAGRGGRSDEASIFAPTVVAITPVFEEHLGVLGRDVAAIAEDKIGIAAAATRALISAPQPGPVRSLISAEPRAEIVRPFTSGLHATNALVGRAAAARLLDTLGLPSPVSAPGPVLLPGRLSEHVLSGTRVVIDAAISREAIAAAMEFARDRFGRPPDHVLLSLPDDKDLEGVEAELAGVPVHFVRLARPHLTYRRAVPWTAVAEDAVDRSFLARLGRHVVCLGTISFVGLLLDLLDVDTERLWPPRAPGGGHGYGTG